jgi:hypothetical protein
MREGTEHRRYAEIRKKEARRHQVMVKKFKVYTKTIGW